MTFHISKKFKDLYAPVDVLPLSAYDMRSARSELEYVGIEIGRMGLICIEGGKK